MRGDPGELERILKRLVDLGVLTPTSNRRQRERRTAAAPDRRHDSDTGAGRVRPNGQAVPRATDNPAVDGSVSDVPARPDRA
jgi:hypothetical protein